VARFKDLRLSDEEARALVAVREQGAIDNAMYRELNRVDTLAASQALRRLRDAGLLEQKGRGSATFYQPTARLLDVDGGSEGNSASLSSESAPLSSNPASLPSNLLLAQLPGDLQALVAGLGQRAQANEVRAALVALCRNQDWQAAELGQLLGRNPDYLATRYLRPLVGEGVLRYTRPEQPNHPDQAYRTADADGIG
jgi:ATP-dependent DNA helicase RecG